MKTIFPKVYTVFINASSTYRVLDATKILSNISAHQIRVGKKFSVLKDIRLFDVKSDRILII